MWIVKRIMSVAHRSEANESSLTGRGIARGAHFRAIPPLLKALYLATFEAAPKWTSTIRNWAQDYGELSIMYDGRL